MASSALEKACETIVSRAVPKAGETIDGRVVVGEADIIEIIDKIGAVIVMVIEACAANLPMFSGAPDAAVTAITSGLRSPSFLTRIRFRNLVAQEIGSGFFSRYTGEIAREAVKLAAEDEEQTKAVVREVIAPGPLRPDFRF